MKKGYQDAKRCRKNLINNYVHKINLKRKDQLKSKEGIQQL